MNDYDGVWERWEHVVGIAHLRCLHLNDSKTPFGSRRDRHELLAEGSLGASPFRRIMRDPRFVSIPKILETPKGDDLVSNDRRMLGSCGICEDGERGKRATDDGRVGTDSRTNYRLRRTAMFSLVRRFQRSI